MKLLFKGKLFRAYVEKIIWLTDHFDIRRFLVSIDVKSKRPPYVPKTIVHLILIFAKKIDMPDEFNENYTFRVIVGAIRL